MFHPEIHITSIRNLQVGDVIRENEVVMAIEHKPEVSGFHIHLLTPKGMKVEYFPFFGLIVVDHLAVH